jgi:CubicO group peptidase (beta-lactamase class C family)
MTPMMTIGILVAALAIPQHGDAQESVLPRVAAAEAGLDREALGAATTLLEEFVAQGRIAGAVAAVARDGKLGYLEAVGVQDLESQRQMSDSSLFRIYSMTKPVTAVAAMMLHEQGRFELDDPVEMYLPEFSRVQVRDRDGTLRPPSRPITVRDLFLHTAGLSHRTSAEYREAGVRSRREPLPRLVEKMVAVPLREDPGTRYRYSESPTILGRLIEVWSGRPLDVYLEEHLFRPLGMVDTRFWVEGEARARLAEVYGPDPAAGLRPVQMEEVPFTERPDLLEGTVGLVSSTRDFLRFGQMLLNGGSLGSVRILSPETVRMIVVHGLGPDVAGGWGGRTGWGLGNVGVDLDSGDYGWNGSAGTAFWVDPSARLVAVLMTQTSPPFPDDLRVRFESAVRQAVRR